MEDIETTGSDICCTARALLKRSQAGKCRVAEVVIEKRAECFFPRKKIKHLFPCQQILPKKEADYGEMALRRSFGGRYV